MVKVIKDTTSSLLAEGLGFAVVWESMFVGTLLPALNAYTLGQMLALYEHKVFCLGVLWNLNSFDQWGVELGKELAGELLPMVKGKKPVAGRNGSTEGLLKAFHAMREG